MSFISYAQNYEDVMLWRALKNINKGFYLDVGAWSPDVDSVTKLFYENGWSGINLEPNPDFYTQLVERRPKDINLCLAVSDKPGVLEMNFLSSPGLSTLDDDIAKKHEASGYSVNKQKVDVSTLATIWKRFVPKNQDVHFLKIDVEGLEEAVLSGGDWEVFRPWIVVVEATAPMTQDELHMSWEHILLSANYRLAYADGLNLYYVAQEHLGILPSFKYPPNVFDDFKPIGQVKAEVLAISAQEEVQSLQAELALVYSSRSWRFTKGLRSLKNIREYLTENYFFTSAYVEIKKNVKCVVVLMIRYIIARDSLKKLLLIFVNHFPMLKHRIIRVVPSTRELTLRYLNPSNKNDLHPRAKDIYNGLRKRVKSGGI